MNDFLEEYQLKNLDEIELFQIKKMIKIIETKYTNFTNQLLNTNKFQLIEIEKGKISNINKKSSEQLSEYFYIYYIMLSQNTNIDKILVI